MFLSKTCILTDNSVIFSTLDFPGRPFVYLLPQNLQDGQQISADVADLPKEFPSSYFAPKSASALSPSVEDFYQAYYQLSEQYDTILVILVSSYLSNSVNNAQEATARCRVGASIRIIDSQTLACGLGFLVQTAAESLTKGLNGIQIHSLIRGMIPHIYSILCIKELSYLAKAGQLDPEQAFVGEMLNFIPFFVIENGKLQPIQKARNPRQIVDVLEEFILEFNQPAQIAIVHGTTYLEEAVNALRERLSQNWPGIYITTHTMNPALIQLLGPHSLGIFTLEKMEII